MAYSNAPTDKLYGLLPAVIRARDAEGGEPLRALLAIAETAADAIDADIGQLGRDAFIETCEPWAIPYIGDLIGTTPLFDESRVTDAATATALFPDLTGPDLTPPVALRGRADVGKTIFYRRRKGTLPMLEQLARDVTGWAAHTVATFELLAWTQWVRNHVRLEALGTPNLRSPERCGRINGPFDFAMHTVDVRTPVQDPMLDGGRGAGLGRGRYGIPDIMFYLWRLTAFRLERVVARRLGGPGDARFHFSPLGQSAPLFSRAISAGDDAPLADELSIPQPIRPARFFADLQAYAALPAPRPGFTAFYGLFEGVPGFNVAPAPSLMVMVGGVPVPPEDVLCRDLSSWSLPAPGKVAVDVALGRLTLGMGLTGLVAVFYHAGFPAALGGGPYRRRAWLVRTALAQAVLIVDGSGAPGTFATVGAALAQWVTGGGVDTLIRIQDNRTYAETLALNTAPATGTLLAIEAADGFRPHLRLGVPLVITGAREDFTLTLGGCLIEGRIDLQGSLRAIRLLHTTLVPGVSIAEADPPPPPLPPPSPPEPSITAAGGNTELSVELAFSITGPLRLPAEARGIVLLDSIVDGVGLSAIAAPGGVDAPGPPLRAERSTIRGRVHVREIDVATEVVFDGTLRAERIQIGCVRFSAVDPASRTPRRYRCQPDLAEADAIEAAGTPLTPAQIAAIRAETRARVHPDYTDTRYGQPAYLQLARTIAPEIAEGAEDGSEMGAFSHLKQPQRAGNLRQRLGEYLPFGLEYGVEFET